MALNEEQKAKLASAFKGFEEKKAVNQMVNNIQTFWAKQAEKPRAD